MYELKKKKIQRLFLLPSPKKNRAIIKKRESKRKRERERALTRPFGIFISMERLRNSCEKFSLLGDEVGALQGVHGRK